jgi:O-antigen/teichoic acid export membrane protein
MGKNPDSLAKKSLILIFAQVVVNIASIAQAVILTRLLLKSEMGTYNEVFIVAGYYLVFALGLPESITFFIARSRTIEEKIEKQSAIMTIALIMIVLIMLLLTLADPWIASYFRNDQLRGMGAAIGLIFVGNIVQALFQNTSVVTNHVRDAAKMSISYSLGNIAVIASLFFFKNNIRLFIWLLAIYNLIMMVLRITTVMGYFNFKLRIKINGALIKDILSYGIPICLATMISTISRSMDKTIVGHFYTLDQVASFSQAARELPYNIITAAIVTVLMPKVIENYNNGVINQSVTLWKKGIVSSSYLIFFAIASNILLAREIITVLYSTKYLDSTPVFIVYTFLLVSRITYWGMFLQAMKKPKLVMYVSIFSLVSNLVLNLVFIKIWGMVGSALATIVTSYASVVIYIYLNCKYMKVKVTEMIPFGKLGSIIGVNVVAYGVFWLIQNLFLIKVTVGGPVVDSLFRIGVIGGLWALGYAFIFRKDLMAIIKSLRA